MMYLLYGDVLYLIDKEIDKIIKENNIDDINISRYELDSSNFQDIIDDASTISLFAAKKLIIVNNAYLFTSANKSGNVTLFEEYIPNYNPDTIIIFKLNESKIDERKKVVKLIKKYGVVKDFNKKDNTYDMVKTLFDNYHISKDNINYLIERIGEDIYTLKQEIDKIKLYKNDNLEITREDINNLTSQNIEMDMFKLMDAIINDNKEEALNLYQEMLKYNLEPIQIIISLANKYRLMYQAKELYIKGYNENEICKELGQQNPKYIYVLIKNGRQYDSNKLISILKSLADLDYNIKSGFVNPNLAFELFILQK